MLKLNKNWHTTTKNPSYRIISQPQPSPFHVHSTTYQAFEAQPAIPTEICGHNTQLAKIEERDRRLLFVFFFASAGKHFLHYEIGLRVWWTTSTARLPAVQSSGRWIHSQIYRWRIHHPSLDFSVYYVLWHGEIRLTFSCRVICYLSRWQRLLEPIAPK